MSFLMNAMCGIEVDMIIQRGVRTPFQGCEGGVRETQGVALGCYGAAPLGRWMGNGMVRLRWGIGWGWA